jgi:hypothetical protein
MMEKLSQNYKYGEETKLMKLFKKKKEKRGKMKRRRDGVPHTQMDFSFRQVYTPIMHGIKLFHH